MGGGSRRLLGDVAPFVWPLLVLVGLVDFLVVDVLSGIRRVPLPEDWRTLVDFQEKAAPLVANLALLTAALALVLVLPGLARRRQQRLLAGLVVAGLLVLALNVLRRVVADTSLLTWQNALFAALHVVVGLRALACRRRGFFVAGPLCIALALPHLWRLAFEMQGEEMAGLRNLGDIALPVVLAGLVLVPKDLLKHKVLLVVAALPAVALLYGLLRAPEHVRDFLDDATHLWLTTLPSWLLTVLLPLAVFAVVRLILDAAVLDRNAGVAAAVTLWICAGFLPKEAQDLLMSFLGTCALAFWAVSGAEKKRDLASLV